MIIYYTNKHTNYMFAILLITTLRRNHDLDAARDPYGYRTNCHILVDITLYTLSLSLSFWVGLTLTADTPYVEQMIYHRITNPTHVKCSHYGNTTPSHHHHITHSRQAFAPHSDSRFMFTAHRSPSDTHTHTSLFSPN